jgi:hypothetical protein
VPPISLVVCLYNERDLFARLLRESTDCRDDLVVVHDGPDTTGVRTVAEQVGGRFFERPRAFQQEPHWPFAWSQAKYDWILRLDADEFPSAELKHWLEVFRQSAEPPTSVSGYTCIWPLWNGHSAVSKKWPAGRHFLFNRNRVRFFGMVEQVPVPDGRFETLDFVLRHQPARNSYGLANLLLRRQAYRWRECIAQSLLGQPSELNCWRWENAPWPSTWEAIRQHPFRTALKRLFRGPLSEMHVQWRREGRVFPIAALGGPLHHALICLEFWRQHHRRRRQEKTSAQKNPGL